MSGRALSARPEVEPSLIPWQWRRGGGPYRRCRAEFKTYAADSIPHGPRIRFPRIRGAVAEVRFRKTTLGRPLKIQFPTSCSDAGIIALGPRFGVPADFLDAAPYKPKLDGDAEQHYTAAIVACRADLIVLAGFMRVLKLPFLTKFEGKIINLHPSLLPSFRGSTASARRFAAA